MAYTTINKSSDYFNTKLYTGNGSTQSITGVGFQPDLVYVKGRSDATFPTMTDVVRGTGKELYTNQNWSETTAANLLTSFDTDGFSVGSDGGWNASGETKVAWNWKANGAGSSNTDGSTNSTVSVNTTAGFSIVKYTGNGSAGTTVGHGLGSVPKMIIIKATSYGQDWFVYHEKLGNNSFLNLNGNGAAFTSSSPILNNTTPTSSLITLGSHSHVNTNNETYIAYCFAEKTGYSKIGSYTGNGNTNGPFVYTGFKPAFVLHKKVSAADDWNIFDSKRNPHNVVDKYLIPNNNGVEGSSTNRDFLSNGFKIRSSSSYVNLSGATFIYMAFASAPLVGTNNVTAKAR